MKNEYVESYIAAYLAMKDAAYRAIKSYGKTLDVYEICKQRIMEKNGYESESEITEDELYDIVCCDIYSCYYEGKHGHIYSLNIMAVRYNESSEDIEVFLEDDGGCIAEWFPISLISGNVDSVYQTILDFIS